MEESEVLKKIQKVEGKIKLHESKFVLAKRERLKLYFEAHKTCSRCMIVGNPAYQDLTFMFLNPSYIQNYFTEKYMIDVIMYNRMNSGRRQ